jgi:molybdenum-dependent DNA-binding transcriptional regulator ModE
MTTAKAPRRKKVMFTRDEANHMIGLLIAASNGSDTPLVASLKEKLKEIVRRYGARKPRMTEKMNDKMEALIEQRVSAALEKFFNQNGGTPVK